MDMHAGGGVAGRSQVRIGRPEKRHADQPQDCQGQAGAPGCGGHAHGFEPKSGVLALLYRFNYGYIDHAEPCHAIVEFEEVLNTQILDHELIRTSDVVRIAAGHNEAESNEWFPYKQTLEIFEHGSSGSGYVTDRFERDNELNRQLQGFP
jgi:hypothetical protein